MGDVLKITPLGAGNEVGRSCFVLSFKNKNVMLDCGIHPAFSGISSLPFLDMDDSDGQEMDLSAIDVLLVSHFHLDHCGGVAYLTEKTNFKGRVFMTHPTKAIYKMLMQDYASMASMSSRPDQLFDREDLERSLKKIEVVSFHQEIEHAGIKFWCYNAGHVLGACMWMVEIADVRVLYTGDFSRVEDRHLASAETTISPNVLLIESTYGVQTHVPRLEREMRFRESVEKIVKGGGRCLLPVFALGRAQEILLILEEHWRVNPELHSIPIYYASNLAKKAMAVYQTFVNMMNESVWKGMENPFNFKFVRNLKTREEFQDMGPCVVMASPGMLQNGFSRDLFEQWCSSEQNGVVFTGYAVDQTLAKTVMSEPKTITSQSGVEIPCRLKVDYISFSAHSDFEQTSHFISEVQPNHVILIHGDSNEMNRLHNALNDKYGTTGMQIHAPGNMDPVKIMFEPDRSAKVVGSLANSAPVVGDRISGVVIKEHFSQLISSAHDIPLYTTLATTEVFQRQAVHFNAHDWDAFTSILMDLFESVTSLGQDAGDTKQFIVSDIVTATLVEAPSRPQGFQPALDDSATLLLEWKASPFADAVAEAVLHVALLLSDPRVLRSASSDVRGVGEDAEKEGTWAPVSACEDENVLNAIGDILRDTYGPCRVDVAAQQFHLIVEGVDVLIDYQSKGLECSDPELEERIKSTLRYIETALYPIP